MDIKKIVKEEVMKEISEPRDKFGGGIDYTSTADDDFFCDIGTGRFIVRVVGDKLEFKLLDGKNHKLSVMGSWAELRQLVKTLQELIEQQ